MPDEVTNISEVKQTSDGSVKISIETYNDLVKMANKPPVINRTQIVKTAEMAAKEYRMWGNTFMGLGGSMFVIGAWLHKAGR
jgi:hypothetical protein